MRKTVSSVAFLAVVLWGRIGVAQKPASTWTIPGTVNAGGLNNTRFVSDLAVTNPGSVPVQATISFIPAGGTTPKQVTLGAGQTLAYRNVLDSLWGAQGAGATQVAGDAPLLIRARTYNTAASGTYGVALPVFADDRLLEIGDTAHSLWISQSANGNSGYRTNIAVVFPDAGGGSGTVTVFDADGVSLGSQGYDLDAPGFQQFSVASFAGAVPVSRAELVVTRGRGAGYSVVVDNVTGDSSLFTFEDLPAGYQDVVVNGVARANGRNSTFFRTDGRFYNPSSTDATVTVSFHANQGSNPTPLTGTFAVPAGKIRDVVDVLDSLLGLPVGSAGALRFRTDVPVAVLCRTSNVDPFGVVPGTFGAQQKPRPLLSFLMSADAGAVVTGIRQNAAFRTNVGFAAGADGAAYSLTLKAASGATVGTANGSLGPFGWTQPNVQDLFAAAIPDDATMLVRVTSGSVDVFDSSIDNASGDPVVTPIMPLSSVLPSAATIGPAGGSIRSDDGAVTLRIPAGALAAAVAIAIASAPNGAPAGVGPGYDISPDGLAFAKPALLSVDYGPHGLDVPDIDTLTLAIQRGASWAGLTGGRIDTGARTLTIALAGTNPPPASSRTAGRATRASSGTSRHVFLRGLEIQTTGQWVVAGGKMDHINLIFYLPPSSRGAEPQFYDLGQLTLDRANTGMFPPKIGTIGAGLNLGEFSYSAPASIAHATVPVTLRARASVTRGGVPFGIYEATKTVNIVRRRWALRVGFKLNLACSGSNTEYSYSYADDQEQDFHLEDSPSGFVLVKDPTLASLPDDATVKGCRCSITSVGTPGVVTFPNVTGKLTNTFSEPSRRFPSRFELSGKAVIENMIPVVKYDCPNPIPPPATLSFVDDATSYDFDLLYGLLADGGLLRPHDGNAKFIILEPPLLEYTVEWHSIAD
ncbi:MAG TPA: hypothetical protein VGM13_01860 [Thermoanaerobaculia bacterium]|jgi:hypothetical protein